MKNGKILSEQLSYLPDELVSEAMETPAKQAHKFGIRRVLRAAACLAVILGLLFGIPYFSADNSDTVTGESILSVKVYAMNPVNNHIVEDELTAGVAVNNTHYWPLVMNLYRGIPIFLSVETEDFPADKITYDIHVDHGEYFIHGNTSAKLNRAGQDFSTPNNAGIYWNYSKEEYQDYQTHNLDVVYTSITIRCEDHIVGYALLRFDRAYGRDILDAYPDLADYWKGCEDEPADAYWSNLIVSVSFPKVNGEYQQISQEYVDACINKAISAL